MPAMSVGGKTGVDAFLLNHKKQKLYTKKSGSFNTSKSDNQLFSKKQKLFGKKSGSFNTFKSDNKFDDLDCSQFFKDQVNI